MHHLHRTPRLPLVAATLVSLLTPLALAFSPIHRVGPGRQADDRPGERERRLLRRRWLLRPDGLPAAPAYGRHLSGTCVIKRRGRLVLHDPKRGREVATLALIATPSGKALPRTKGIWLDLSINPPKGRSFVDGNRMNFLR